MSPAENPDRRPLGRELLFPGSRAVWLEVGFGGGEHLVHQAAEHPEVGFLGCEPFVNGVAKALAAIEAAGVTDVRVHPGDVDGALEALSGFASHMDEACVGSVSEIFDADAPFTARGCVAQAWSVAELLRVTAKLSNLAAAG